MATALITIRTWLATRVTEHDEESGASLVEYALLVALIAIVCIVAVTFLGETASSSFSSMGQSLAS